MLGLPAISLLVLGWGVSSMSLKVVTVAMWGSLRLRRLPVLRAMVVQRARDGANLASTLNISALNLGNAVGAGIGAVAIAHGVPLAHVPILAGTLALVGLTMSGAAVRLKKTFADMAGTNA